MALRVAASAIDLDTRLLRAAVAWGARAGVSEAMRLASRLGDGPVWLAVGAAALLAGGAEGRVLALEGLLTAALGALLYRACKTRFVRERPFVSLPDLPILWSPPEDFSFPSGHALHACAWATLVALHFGLLAAPVLVLAGIIALSRVVLAVHYPSDVVAGGVFGATLALLVAAAV
jgi:undecaprenyl-diphosphatase